MAKKSDANKTQQFPPGEYYEPLAEMYPDIYKRVCPYVLQATEMYDRPNNPEFYPYPRRAAVERLADRVYQRVSQCPEFSEDFSAKQFFDRDILRPLIIILLIRELTRRRGFFYF